MISAAKANLRVIGALGLRSVRQTFRRPQLISPIVIFPTLLLAVQTGGAAGAIHLHVGGVSFPHVDSFLQFMLAGAMMQSLMLAGNSGGIALAEHLLLGLAARVRGEAPRTRQVVPVAREQLIAQHPRRVVVVDRDPLELEEAQQVLELHERHVDGGVEVALILAVDVRRQPQARVGSEPRDASRCRRGAAGGVGSLLR